MPDISMCTGTACIYRTKCYRYTAQPNENQSYFQPEEVGEDCEYFIKNE
jgi:hypothetical protein